MIFFRARDHITILIGSSPIVFQESVRTNQYSERFAIEVLRSRKYRYNFFHTNATPKLHTAGKVGAFTEVHLQKMIQTAIAMTE